MPLLAFTALCRAVASRINALRCPCKSKLRVGSLRRCHSVLYRSLCYELPNHAVAALYLLEGALLFQAFA
jgi:hypothetical protein